MQAVVKSPVLIQQKAVAHIDRWQLEFDVEKHRQCDSDRPWLPAIVLRYLSSNYPAVVIEEILSQLVDVDRGRSVVLCHSCETLRVRHILDLCFSRETKPNERVYFVSL